MPNTVEWSELPSELLAVVAKKLPTLSDYLRFRSVCRPWRAAAKPGGAPPSPPCLLLDADPSAETFPLYSLSTGAVHLLRIPEARGRRVVGSRHGWLAVADAATQTLTLLNPITGSQIPLPPSGIPTDEVASAFLSSTPTSPSGCVIVLSVYDSQTLASCRRLGPDAWSRWSSVTTDLPVGSYGNYEVAYHKGKLCAANDSGLLSISDPAAAAAAKTTLIPAPPLETGSCIEELFLVEDAGELLLAGTSVKAELFFSGREYFLYRLDESGERPRWARVGSMGGRSLFLCRSQSMLVHAARVPGFKRDCLYIPESFMKQGKWYQNVTIFHWRTYDVERLKCKLDRHLFFGRSPPAWLLPSLC